ncbi:MAG: sulfatase [Acidobacteriota bacterium]
MKNLILYILLISIFLNSCGKKVVSETEYFPETIDGVTSFSFSDFSMENYFTGNWGPPIFRSDKRLSRELTKGEGSLEFIALKPERYILNAQYETDTEGISAKLNKKEFNLTAKNKFISSKKINRGRNSLTILSSPGLRFRSLDIYPKRITRIRNFRELIRDDKVLFLPGTIRYFINPFHDEELILTLDLNGKRKVNLKVEIFSESKNLKYYIKAGNLKKLKIKLLGGRFQEVRITPEGQKGNYIRIENSLLARTNPVGRKNIDDMTVITKGKNLLFILLDAARNDHMGYNGHKRDTTPNIDSFSKDSFVFRNCYSEASYTLASTGTLLTGLPPDFHSVISKQYSSLNKKSITLAKLFSIKGYYTGSITGNPNYSKAFNYNIGFTDFLELFSDHPVVDAAEFIKPFENMLEKAGEKPFFIYLHIREPHDPFIMPHPFLGKFQSKFTSLSKDFKDFGKAFGQSFIKEGPKTELLKKIYDENLAYGDMVFGRIISILKNRKLLRDTMIVFLSDHGEAIGENGNIGHGHVLYQQGLRIPLVIKIPGKKGKHYDCQVITSDLVKTITEIFGLSYPYSNVTSGRNLFSKDTGRRLIARSINIFNYPGYMTQQYPFKLITHFPFSPERAKLYDLEKDPGEKNPVEGETIIRKTLLFNLFNHIKRSEKIKFEILKPKLRKSDIESLKSLGYI